MLSNNDRHRLINSQVDHVLTKQTVFGRIADKLDRDTPELTTEQQFEVEAAARQPIPRKQGQSRLDALISFLD